MKEINTKLNFKKNNSKIIQLSSRSLVPSPLSAWWRLQSQQSIRGRQIRQQEQENYRGTRQGTRSGSNNSIIEKLIGNKMLQNTRKFRKNFEKTNENFEFFST